jgi:hypothetical protein
MPWTVVANLEILDALRLHGSILYIALEQVQSWVLRGNDGINHRHAFMETISSGPRERSLLSCLYSYM